MTSIYRYIKDYFLWIDRRLYAMAALFMALAIFCNYYWGLDNYISTLSAGQKYAAWYFTFLGALGFGYLLLYLFKQSRIFNNIEFLALLFFAPALFAWKMVSETHFNITADSVQNAYWNHVLYWPTRLLVITAALFVIWKVFDKEQPFYGTSTKQFIARPYFIMLLIMVPLIAAASTQHDFLRVYPKLKNISFLSSANSRWYYQLLYELSYGSDFFSIELFFRGFLILAFAKWVGRDAILPMALFYCTIHFGKPLGECISSFFGGTILGIVTYHTRTIWGGLIVHLGIAWLMELGGYLGTLHLLS